MPANQIIALLLISIPTLSYGQKSNTLTADQIVDSSILFCGGESQISKVKSSRINYLLRLPDQTSAIINEQRKTGNKYVQSILSKTHRPQTTFFNGKKISKVDGDSITHITDLESTQEVKLRTYNQIQYGYKQLNYKLKRLEDQKFKNFHCFVVSAEADNGYKTINFFDKTNFRLLLVVYPNGNKSALIEYVYRNNVLFNSHVVNTFSNSKDLQVLKLHSIDLNDSISDMWFNCPYTNRIHIPEFIKKGKFKSTNGANTTFNRTAVSMDYLNDKKNITLRRYVDWNILTPDAFGLINESEMKKKEEFLLTQILVRIVSWNEHGYVCQWITDTQTDTQDYTLFE